jgi:hypothetical protein
MCLTLEMTDENYAVNELHQRDQVMQHRHMKMYNYGVPTHDNAKLRSTNTRKRPIMEYQHMKKPYYRLPTHENAYLWSTAT